MIWGLLLAAFTVASDTDWFARAALLQTQGDTAGARAAYLQAAYLDESAAPRAYLEAGRLAEAEGETGAAWWSYRRGLLVAHEGDEARADLEAAFRRLGGDPSDLAAAREEWTERTATPATSVAQPFLSYDLSVGYLSNDNLILLPERGPNLALLGINPGDAGYKSHADLSFHLPIGRATEVAVGGIAGGSLYNDAHPLESLDLGAYASVYRTFGERLSTNVMVGILQEEVGHDAYLENWSISPQVVYSLSPRWSIQAAYLYEDDEYVTNPAASGPVWDASAVLSFRPGSNEDDVVSFGYHRGRLDASGASNWYEYGRYEVSLDFDWGRRIHFDAGAAVEGRDYERHIMPQPATPQTLSLFKKGPREDLWWTGEVGLTYKFRENVRLRAYYLYYENRADNRLIVPPSSYTVQEVGLAFRIYGDIPLGRRLR